MGARRDTDNRGLGPDNSVSMATSVPDRVRWAVEALDIHPNEGLLEVGPGPALRLGHWFDPNTAHHRSMSLHNRRDCLGACSTTLVVSGRTNSVCVPFWIKTGAG